ncbi:MAG: hypothetical protein O3A14_19400 [Cyanobacteria bacterium]|nr:hypothetical protein [Cyanobacteriota bacterium]
MSQSDGVATDKAKLFAYVEPELKAKIEQLADARFRSVSNLVESVMADEIRRAEQAGEIPSEAHQPVLGDQ